MAIETMKWTKGAPDIKASLEILPNAAKRLTPQQVGWVIGEAIWHAQTYAENWEPGASVTLDEIPVNGTKYTAELDWSPAWTRGMELLITIGTRREVRAADRTRERMLDEDPGFVHSDFDTRRDDEGQIV